MIWQESGSIFYTTFRKSPPSSLRCVLVKSFSARLAFIAKPTDKTQDNGYRLGLAIITSRTAYFFVQK
ncbi:hypothetical protein [Bacillus cereus]|uniref:hypothetical protein n=1 Tax=Bacillus cereus TaxID=1396 RepID=UPI001155557A|nr:hypothetical protein [Bacillus cereus]